MPFNGMKLQSYRVQVWDFSNGEIPDIADCKYYKISACNDECFFLLI